MHADARTVWGESFADYAQEPFLEGEAVSWRPAATTSADPEVVASVQAPFAREGGLRLLTGNLGRSVIKISAVKAEHRRVAAAAVVIDSQAELVAKFEESGQNIRELMVAVAVSDTFRYQLNE